MAGRRPGRPSAHLAATLCSENEVASLLVFIWLIIRLFSACFLAKTVFFSHNKLNNSVFQPACQHSRTSPPSVFCLSQVSTDTTHTGFRIWSSVAVDYHGLNPVYIMSINSEAVWKVWRGYYLG
jgi:hypothetical protein